MWIFKKASASVALTLSLYSGFAQASGGMPSCFIGDALGIPNAGLKLGTLDFGSPPRNFIGVLMANATGGGAVAGATQIVCSPDIEAIAISVTAGNNVGQGGTIGIGTRAMKQGSSYLPYEVYSDPAMTNAYPADATPMSVTLPGTGAAINLPVYGRIRKTSTVGINAGTYMDTLQVTLIW